MRYVRHTITLCEVTALDHELLDDAVKGRAFIAISFLPRGEGTEVLHGLGHCLAIKPNDHSSQWLITMRNIEVNLCSIMTLVCLVNRGRGNPYRPYW